MPDAASGRTFEVPIGDENAVKGVSPDVSRIANSIGFALAERGVQFTAADATAAAQRVVDQHVIEDAIRSAVEEQFRPMITEMIDKAIEERRGLIETAARADERRKVLAELQRAQMEVRPR